MKFKVKKFIQTSTSEVYGTPKKVPIKEDHPLNAQSPYAATKIASDQLALSFYLSFGLPVTVIRPFNTFGPRQSLRAIIPTIIDQFIDEKNINFLKNNREDGKSFIKLASNLNGNEFQSFMMGESNLLTKLKIINSMPKLPFIKELFK